ncbi:MAG: hypothetical protein ACI8XO_004679, partial [Verrucomicrobiales bacterium]
GWGFVHMRLKPHSTNRVKWDTKQRHQTPLEDGWVKNLFALEDDLRLPAPNRFWNLGGYRS